MRFRGDEEEIACDQFFIRRELDGAGGLTGVESGEEFLQDRQLGFNFGVVGFGGLFGLGVAFLDGIKVGEQ